MSFPITEAATFLYFEYSLSRLYNSSNLSNLYLFCAKRLFSSVNSSTFSFNFLFSLLSFFTDFINSSLSVNHVPILFTPSCKGTTIIPVANLKGFENDGTMADKIKHTTHNNVKSDIKIFGFTLKLDVFFIINHILYILSF